VAIQEFDFTTGKVLNPNRRQAIVLASDAADSDLIKEQLRQKHYKLLGVVDNVRTALEKVGLHKVGILFLDADIEGINATELMQMIMKKYPEFNVVLMTEKATKEMLVEVQKLGAAGFLLKPLASEAIEKVLSRIK
jgi:DNA-binding NtrC family response regulator